MGSTDVRSNMYGTITLIILVYSSLLFAEFDSGLLALDEFNPMEYRSSGCELGADIGLCLCQRYESDPETYGICAQASSSNPDNQRGPQFIETRGGTQPRLFGGPYGSSLERDSEIFDAFTDSQLRNGMDAGSIQTLTETLVGEGNSNASASGNAVTAQPINASPVSQNTTVIKPYQPIFGSGCNKKKKK